MTRIAVIIEDDWELRGDGSGNVAGHQYLPARFLMDIAEKHGVPVTFMVEVLQQIAFKAGAETDCDIRLQAALWDETVLAMHERGFDVQLHLHPQWYGVTPQSSGISLTAPWNIGSYAPEAQTEMIRLAKGYLDELLPTAGGASRIIAFKAGNWGLQPSESLLNNLVAAEIRWVMGVCRDLYVPEQNTDYRQLDEDTLCYSPEFTNICKASSQNRGIQVIPMAHSTLDPVQIVRIAAARIGQRLVDRLRAPLPPSVTRKSKGGGEGSQQRIIRGFGLANHVQIGNLPYSAMKAMFDQARARLRKSTAELVPLVVECHTKTFTGNYRNVEKFVQYMAQQPDIEFHDLTSFDAAARALAA